MNVLGPIMMITGIAIILLALTGHFDSPPITLAQ